MDEREANNDDDGPVVSTTTDETNRLASDLHGAVGRGEIVAFYQPQYAVDSHAIVSAEALSRWIHPELGMIPPATFIPLAEETGLISEIGDHMIILGCESAAGWQHRDIPVEVAVNVSAIQLRDAHFAPRLAQLLHRFDVPPSLLTIEVTESTEILDVSTVAERLDWLRSVGVTISIDDFGTGHSSVAQALGLRATELKIDQSLVQEDSAASELLLSAVVTFAHDKGLRVVAEGVETDAQLSRVRRLRCDRAQGFLLGRPVSKNDFDQLLLAS